MNNDEKLRHAWRTIGLIIRKHKGDFTGDEWLMMCLASSDVFEELGFSPIEPEEWPDTLAEQWESLG